MYFRQAFNFYLNFSPCLCFFPFTRNMSINLPPSFIPLQKKNSTFPIRFFRRAQNPFVKSWNLYQKIRHEIENVLRIKSWDLAREIKRCVHRNEFKFILKIYPMNCKTIKPKSTMSERVPKIDNLFRRKKRIILKCVHVLPSSCPDKNFAEKVSELTKSKKRGFFISSLKLRRFAIDPICMSRGGFWMGLLRMIGKSKQ